jgi:hypothetical protein
MSWNTSSSTRPGDFATNICGTGRLIGAMAATSQPPRLDALPDRRARQRDVHVRARKRSVHLQQLLVRVVELRAAGCSAALAAARGP